MGLKIKVTTSNPELSGLLLRQTTGRQGVWKHCQFYVDRHVDACDWWFVCHNSALMQEQSAICDPNHIVFISMEPYEQQPQSFYDQFAHVVACDLSLRHRSILRGNGLSWWAGINVDFQQGHSFLPHTQHDYDSFNSSKIPPFKNDQISIITSNKCFFPGHQRRLAFIHRLMNSPLSNYIDLYGGGYRPIPDKLDALLSYKYHIVLENSEILDYWTEKLADAFLGYCLPFYHGCPNINDYFPENSYVPINIESNSAMIVIEKALKSNLYDKRLEAISIARNLVLNDFNLFEVMTSIATRPASFLQRCTLRRC